MGKHLINSKTLPLEVYTRSRPTEQDIMRIKDLRDSGYKTAMEHADDLLGWSSDAKEGDKRNGRRKDKYKKDLNFDTDIEEF